MPYIYIMFLVICSGIFLSLTYRNFLSIHYSTLVWIKHNKMYIMNFEVNTSRPGDPEAFAYHNRSPLCCIFSLHFDKHKSPAKISAKSSQFVREAIESTWTYFHELALYYLHHIFRILRYQNSLHFIHKDDITMCYYSVLCRSAVDNRSCR